MIYFARYVKRCDRESKRLYKAFSESRAKAESTVKVTDCRISLASGSAETELGRNGVVPVTEHRSVCFVQKIGWYRGYSVPYAVSAYGIFLLKRSYISPRYPNFNTAHLHKSEYTKGREI